MVVHWWWGEEGMGGTRTESVKIYHAATSGTFK